MLPEDDTGSSADDNAGDNNQFQTTPDPDADPAAADPDVTGDPGAAAGSQDTNPDPQPKGKKKASGKKGPNSQRRAQRGNRRSQLQDAAAAVHADKVREALPDDPEQLKDMLLRKNREAAVLAEQLDEAQTTSAAVLKKAEGFDKLQPVLAAQMKQHAQLIRPVAGIDSGEFTLIAAPLVGAADKIGPVMLAFVKGAWEKTKDGVDEYVISEFAASPWNLNNAALMGVDAHHYKINGGKS